MPTINLKPNSPDFSDHKGSRRSGKKTPDEPTAPLTCCEYPGCTHMGEFKAPKGRDLKLYYSFCLNHVKEYNRAWDFFSGMSDKEIEEHIVSSIHGDRPTWRYDTMARTEALHRKAWKTYSYQDEDAPAGDTQRDPRYGAGKRANLAPEFEALGTLGLEPPVDLATIKTRYKQLAMRYHPDRNRNNPEAEELLKRINMAYTILKIAYQAFEKLPVRA